MLEKADLLKKTDQKTFEKEIAPLRSRLGALQREYRDRGIPVILVVEGWNASGITAVISELIQYLDPRGFSLHSIGAPSDEERARPLLWRFFIRTPQKGRIAIFARSWYSRFLAEKVTGVEWKKELKRSVASINSFERQLGDDGTVFFKFFLHISAEEQKRRLDERETNPFTSWMITKGDWDFHRHYRTFLPIISQVIDETDQPDAPWTVVEANDHNYAVLKVFGAVIKNLEKRLAKDGVKGKDPGRAGDRQESARHRQQPVKRRSQGETAYAESGMEYQALLFRYQDRVRDLQYLLHKRGVPLIIVFEGRDAAGKGGNIMRLVRHMNPRGYDVVPVGKPDATELDHHYLWRFYTRFPKAGHITVYDRSWYGRVLVERVEGICTRAEWKRAYNEINEMEEGFIGAGGGLVKFWLEINRDEQLKRFTARQDDVQKQWKITDEDWRNREKWDQYEEAVDEMLARTSTETAPWTVVESDDKQYARLKTLRTVIDYCEGLFR